MFAAMKYTSFVAGVGVGRSLVSEGVGDSVVGGRTRDLLLLAVQVALDRLLVNFMVLLRFFCLSS